MKLYRTLILLLAALIAAPAALAQVESAGGVRKRTEKGKRKAGEENSAAAITDRMQSFYEAKTPSDADLEWMREIYRQIDLTKDANFPLYYPEDVVDGQENLFRLIFRLVTEGKVPAYEYLDGREVFADKYKIKVGDMLDRFGIYYTEAKGSTEKNPKFNIEEADVPTGQVLNYYILERWEFDRRTNQMKTRVEAICPVLNRTGDYGGEAKYPMFWIKFDALRPYLAQQYVFLTDDNNLPTYSLDDYFNMGMYQGDIYKTKNLRNLSLNQMFPDPDDLKAAQDSIDKRLKSYGADLWVPTREEYLAMQEKAEEEAAAKAAEADKVDERDTAGDLLAGADDEAVEPEKKSVRSKRSKAKAKKKSKAKVKKAPKVKSSGSAPNSGASKSVRRRRR